MYEYISCFKNANTLFQIEVSFELAKVVSQVCFYAITPLSYIQEDFIFFRNTIFFQ